MIESFCGRRCWIEPNPFLQHYEELQDRSSALNKKVKRALETLPGWQQYYDSLSLSLANSYVPDKDLSIALPDEFSENVRLRAEAFARVKEALRGGDEANTMVQLLQQIWDDLTPTEVSLHIENGKSPKCSFMV